MRTAWNISLFMPGHYQALGRVIHAKYLKEQLQTQKRFNFDAARTTMDLIEQLDILADTFYIEVTISWS